MSKMFWEFQEFHLPTKDSKRIDLELYEQLKEFAKWYFKERNINLEDNESILLTMVISNENLGLNGFLKKFQESKQL